MNRAELVRRREYHNIDAMRASTPESHRLLREEVSAQSEEYIQRGGKITQLPINARVVDYSNSETQRERGRRQYDARKKAGILDE